MSYLMLQKNYFDPEKQPFEVVERKGLGHPDTLADGIAHEISSAFSKYTIEKFGIVLHHNVDKVYIGGGMFSGSYREIEFVKPINVIVNGRMSNSFEGNIIDIQTIQKEAIYAYLNKVLQKLDTLTQLKIIYNSSTFTDVSPHWYKPRGIDDLPEYKKLMANDTSVCVSHNPRTYCERLAYDLEHFFWISDGRLITPRFNDVGQDIKVMVIRDNYDIDITLCVPLLWQYLDNWTHYCDRLREIELFLIEIANKILCDSPYSFSLRVNPGRDTEFRKYILSIGSCAECGEEGLVGRGNTNNGVISIFRPHTMESPFGKNPKYHTGRVLNFLTNEISKNIFEKLGCKNSVIGITKNQTSLIPPNRLLISSEIDVSENEIFNIIDKAFELDYVNNIIDSNFDF